MSEKTLHRIVNEQHQLSVDFDRRFATLWHGHRSLADAFRDSSAERSGLSWHVSVFWRTMHGIVEWHDSIGSFAHAYDGLVSGVGLLVKLNTDLKAFAEEYGASPEIVEAVVVPQAELEATYARLKTAVSPSMAIVAAHAAALINEYEIIALYDDQLRVELESIQDTHFAGVLEARNAYLLEESNEGLKSYIDAVITVGQNSQPLRELWMSGSKAVGYAPKSRELADQLFERLVTKELLGEILA